MTRSSAALKHLWPSLLVLAIFAAVLFLVWYPYPFRQFAQSDRFALALALAATFIGPAMTWLVYKTGKRGLMLDLVVIVIIQAAAFGWGAMSLYQNRPYFMVFTVDRFEVLSARDVDFAWIRDERFLDKPFAAPVLLFANMPTDPAAYQKLLREVMFEGKPDLQFRPEYWRLYAEKKNAVLQKSRPLAELRDKRPEAVSAIDRMVHRHDGNIERLRFVPALFRDGQFAVILDADDGDVVDMFLTDPWLGETKP
jgi:hypothetical protein